jgi:hypothetical protein
LQSSNETIELRQDAISMDAIPMIVSAASPAMPRSVAPPRMTRLLSLLALAALVFGVGVLGRGAYFAITDAWVAPLHLSPESREVVALRMQAAKEREERARFESDLTSAAAEIVAIDLSLARLRTLAGGYANAIRWSTSNRDGQLTALAEQKTLLESQRAMAAASIERDQAALDRAKKNVEAGALTATDLETAEENLGRTRLTLSEKQLESVRVKAAIEETEREAAALAGAAGRRAGARRASFASPDVVRLDEVRVNVELQIARLGAERRAAEARERAATASVQSMDELHGDLEATPLFLAAGHEIDLAFVPYAHLSGVHAGDAVYHCQWFLLGCRETGRIKRLFPGEVVTDDPWGSVARGQYVELDMFDRSAVNERTLRVRRAPDLPSDLSSSTP